MRNDATPSWGIFQRDGGHYWKDHGTGDGGDEITFIARFKGWDQQHDFQRILAFYRRVAASADLNEPLPSVEPGPAFDRPARPDSYGMHPGTFDHLLKLSELRLISFAALKEASQGGFLMFGNHLGFEVFGVRDQSRYLFEVKRLDGLPFPPQGRLPERKSHTLEGSMKTWPLGSIEAEAKPIIALLEGLPDFLACFDFIQREGKSSSVAPVAMLSASVRIDPGGLTRFRDKHVRIFPHADDAGFKAAKKWTEQLDGVARSVDYFNFREFQGIKDLADLNRAIRQNEVTLSSEVLL